MTEETKPKAKKKKKSNKDYGYNYGDYGYHNINVKEATWLLLREVSKETGHKQHALADEAIRFWCQKYREFQTEMQNKVSVEILK